MDQHGAPLAASDVFAAGYPPGGGPPGGGGYGPPPGGYGPPPGGYGGPPPGGYGGPPPGGYPPPPGGYGPPPGGYGPPPGGYGGPPGPPPKKSNLGLILGIGCGALFIISILVGGTLIYFANRAAQQLAETPSTAPTTATGGVETSPQGGGPLRAEIRDVRSFKGAQGKLLYFVAELHNTGSEPIGYPNAKLTLYDGQNTALETGNCASLVRVLPPGEKVPCSFTSTRGVGFASFKSEVAPVASFFKGQLAKLAISDTKFTPKRGASPYQVEGKITNESSFTAKSVWAIVSLYGSDAKIVGTAQALVAGKDLPAGGSGRFAAPILDVADTPATWQVLAVGYSE